ncbi:MAG: AraC family transcriptional regulator [Bacteroidales bacterium]|nr:AraC family transcriptional regulator [Bacteroidales bacterium]MBN2821435.1 AraC family transcriptional regulator [Bacteroidales bacterium]
MPEEFFKIIDVIAVFQILVFIIILSRRKKMKDSSRLFLIIFLVSIGICLADRIQFFYRAFLFQNQFPHFYNSGDTFMLVYLPALYLYIKSFTSPGFKLSLRYLWHFFPAIVVFLNLFINYYIQPIEIKYDRLRDAEPFYMKDYQLYVLFGFHILQTLYLFAIIFLIKNYLKHIKDSYSNYNSIQISILYLIPLAGILLRIPDMIAILFNLNISIQIDYILVVYAVLIIYIAYRQPELFLQTIRFEQKSQKMGVNLAIQEKLSQLMKEEKYYMDSGITLTDLADRLKVSARELSAVLNNQFKLSFFNFINNLRIEEAKEMLSDPNNKDTILEILYEVGFNNKSAFNRVFKEKTGLTPTEYRNQVST